MSENRPSGSGFLSPGDIQGIQQAMFDHVISSLGRDPEMAGDEEIYRALALTMRDILVKKWISTQKSYYAGHQKRVYYLSLEFLVGRSLGNSLINLGFFDTATEALKEMGYDLAAVREQEEDAALGNGGLGRLAACFMDSIATLKIPLRVWHQLRIRAVPPDNHQRQPGGTAGQLAPFWNTLGI